MDPAGYPLSQHLRLIRSKLLAELPLQRRSLFVTALFD